MSEGERAKQLAETRAISPHLFESLIDKKPLEIGKVIPLAGPYTPPIIDPTKVKPPTKTTMERGGRGKKRKMTGKKRKSNGKKTRRRRRR